jgi:hypothetical protein
MTSGEMIVLIMLILAGMYLASKVLALIWDVIGGPVSRVFWYFFEWRDNRDVNGFEDLAMSTRLDQGSSRLLPGGSETGSPVLVPGQQNQVEPKMVLNFEIVLSFLNGHKFSDEELIKVLSVLQRQSGDYLLSANKIRDSVGGADAAVKAQVSALRPKKEQPRPASSIRRPADGW